VNDDGQLQIRDDVYQRDLIGGIARQQTVSL